jgi:hypothetical protein
VSSATGVGSSGGWTEEQLAKIPYYTQVIPQMMRDGLFLSEVCEQLGLRPRQVREMRQYDKEFDEDCKDADVAFVDTIEKEAIRRGKEGVLEPVISKGVLVMTTDEDGNKAPLMQRKYSDGLIQFVLKGRRRDVYGDKQEIEQKTTLDLVGMKEELARKFASSEDK